MKEAAAGLVVLEIARTKMKGGTISLTEDELHEALMEAIDLATGGGTDYTPAVQGGRPSHGDKPGVVTGCGVGTA